MRLAEACQEHGRRTTLPLGSKTKKTLLADLKVQVAVSDLPWRYLSIALAVQFVTLWSGSILCALDVD